jgi:hypothetical protein
MIFTTFGYGDLSEAKGLDAVSHYGPSSIGVDTIYMSKGKIPEAFLRNAGLPEKFPYIYALAYERSIRVL